MAYWKDGSKALGSALLMTSARADEEAQHFYWKSGCKYCGTPVMKCRPNEIIFAKTAVWRRHRSCRKSAAR